MKRLITILLIFCICTNSHSENLSATGPGKSTVQLIDFFHSMDVSILNSNNEKVIASYLTEKNKDMIKYLTDKYPEYGPYTVIDPNDEAATWTCLVYSILEATEFNKGGSQNDGPSFQRIPSWLKCALGILGAAYGIPEVINSLGAFQAGNVWTVVRTLVKKYALGWLGTTVAVIQIITECF